MILTKSLASTSRLIPRFTPQTIFAIARPTSSSSGIRSRGFATETELPAGFNIDEVERAEDDVDVCIVGGGPAGLSAAIRLKQLEAERGGEVRVVVLEKGAEVGKSSSYSFVNAKE